MTHIHEVRGSNPLLPTSVMPKSESQETEFDRKMTGKRREAGHQPASGGAPVAENGVHRRFVLAAESMASIFAATSFIMLGVTCE